MARRQTRLPWPANQAARPPHGSVLIPSCDCARSVLLSWVNVPFRADPSMIMLEYRAVPLKLKSYFARTPSPFSHNFLIMARLLTDSQLHIDIVSWHAGVGAVLSAAAPIFPVLILGKMVYGLGIGFALHAAPAYLAEVGHPRIRGLLIRQFPVCICVERHMCCCVLPCTPLHPSFNAQFHDECASVSIWAVKFCVIIIPPSGNPCLFMHALHSCTFA